MSTGTTRAPTRKLVLLLPAALETEHKYVSADPIELLREGHSGDEVDYMMITPTLTAHFRICKCKPARESPNMTIKRACEEVSVLGLVVLAESSPDGETAVDISTEAHNKLPQLLSAFSKRRAHYYETLKHYGAAVVGCRQREIPATPLVDDKDPEEKQIQALADYIAALITSRSSNTALRKKFGLRLGDAAPAGKAALIISEPGAKAAAKTVPALSAEAARASPACGGERDPFDELIESLSEA